jgi:hypothetical protein
VTRHTGQAGGLARTRLEQDMDAELEAEVEYFDHPALGRIRLVDVLVCNPPFDELSIEDEQEATEISS